MCKGYTCGWNIKEKMLFNKYNKQALRQLKEHLVFFLSQIY